MRICLINNLYKPYIRGGAESVVELIAEGLKKDRHEVFIITTKPFFKKQETSSKKQKIYYISGLYFNLNKMPKFLRLFWHLVDMFDLGSYWRVKRILKNLPAGKAGEKPEIVMTHNLKGISYLIPRLIKKLDIKHIHTLHDIQLLHPSGLMSYNEEKNVNNVSSKMYQGLCRLLFGSPDIVVSPSRWLMGEHADRGFFKNSKMVFLPNPVAVSPHPRPLLSKERELGNGIFRFLYVGLIEEHKGVLFLIKAFKKINTPFKIPLNPPLIKGAKGEGGFELIIVGDGSQFKKAQKLIGANKNIKLRGRVKNSEVMDLMHNSDCLIMPSLCYENSPTVIYEAMNNGLPIIASRIGGIPELLNNNSLLFEPNNESDLIDQMKWVMDRREELQATGMAGQEKIKELGIGEYVKKLMSFIN